MILDIGYLANPYSLVEWIDQGCAVYGTRIRAIFELNPNIFGYLDWPTTTKLSNFHIYIFFLLFFSFLFLSFLFFFLFYCLSNAPLKRKILTKVSQKGKERFLVWILGGLYCLAFWFKALLLRFLV